eukprot:CAMPEP_0174746280 /NCGR_PEP_ID=MMETSP1094-20130205/88728_1 /TAXON_ID=156173 /ORGANISM="Chrysochromulina brevifilum, Strain UTEX LB 985" /LENGTH=52 /DNA_ID=CAMNT_0015950963 /DNA_START=18 /DNA_END=172 /DNA_ORIENTATION=+
MDGRADPRSVTLSSSHRLSSSSVLDPIRAAGTSSASNTNSRCASREGSAAHT